MDETASAKYNRQKPMGWKFLIFIMAIFFVSLAITSSVVIYGYRNPDVYKGLGTWGDFTGGLLNPILTFISFIGVLSTLVLQRIELNLTREEMSRSADALEEQGASIKRQIFDSTFFETLKLHNSIVNSIDIQNYDTGLRTTGRDCFRIYYTRLTKIYREKEKGAKNPTDAIILAYAAFWKDAQLDLGHYFRFLYRFFRMIESSGVKDEYYVKLLRSQLSDQELLLLFYNCLSEHGTKFKYLAAKFELFDNMPTVRLLDQRHIGLMPKAAFGGNPMITPKEMRKRLAGGPTA